MNVTSSVASEDILLIPFQEQHLSENYISWLNLYDNVKYSELRHKTHTYENCYTYFQSMLKNQHYFWAIVLPTTLVHIGNISAYIDYPNAIADLAILVGDKNYQGKGLGKKAWQLACDYLLMQRDFRKISAGTMAINYPMLKIFEKTGMEIEAIRKQHYLWEGKAVDIILAAKFHPNSKDYLLT